MKVEITLRSGQTVCQAQMKAIPRKGELIHLSDQSGGAFAAYKVTDVVWRLIDEGEDLDGQISPRRQGWVRVVVERSE